MASSTGAAITRRPDGLLVKQVTTSDAVAQLVGGADRIARLWDAGALQALPAPLDSAVVDVTTTPDGWDIVMRDVSPWLLEHRDRIDETDTGRILDALAAGHAHFDGYELPGLCPLPTWIAFLAPHSISRLAGTVPLADTILAGWERFFATAPPPIADAIAAVHTNPEPLADALRAEGTTLLQGDLWWHNLALTPDHVVLLDWGELTTIGPPALAVIQWLAHDADKLPVGHDQYLARATTTHRHVGLTLTPRAIDLATIAITAQMGWARTGTPDSDWWTQRTTTALRSTGPPGPSD